MKKQLYWLKLKRWILATMIICILFVIIFVTPWILLIAPWTTWGLEAATSGFVVILVLFFFKNQITAMGGFINNLFFKASIERVDKEIGDIKDRLLTNKLNKAQIRTDIKEESVEIVKELKLAKFKKGNWPYKIYDIYKIISEQWSGEAMVAGVIDINQPTTKKDFKKLKKKILKAIKKLKPNKYSHHKLKVISTIITNEAYIQVQQGVMPQTETVVINTPNERFEMNYTQNGLPNKFGFTQEQMERMKLTEEYMEKNNFPVVHKG